MNPKLIGMIAVVAGVLATLSITYSMGYRAGSSRAALICEQAEQKRVKAEQEMLDALRAQIQEREAERQEAERRAADAIRDIRVEYREGKTIIQREVVEMPVYTDCVVSDSVRDTLDAALAGGHMPKAGTVGAGAGALPAVPAAAP